MPNIQLVSNHDGTYDIYIEYNRGDVEFAAEFDSKKFSNSNVSNVIASYAKRAKIKSVKIFASGVLVASVALSSILPVFAATDRYSMGYLYSGTDQQQIEYVNQTHNALDTVSPSYFDIEEDGSLRLNYLSEYLIESMHDKGIKVVPFLSNHWNRTAGINALNNVESLSTQIADYIEEYNLDGVNVDIENVTHEQRDQYTELVRLLRDKIPNDKEISVAVAANPNDWQVGWHGSYDYTALAQYADHLIIMAYDEHYEGGEAGPVAGIDFVESSIQYALEKTTSDKIVVGIPFYGRVWSLDNERIVGKGISSKTIQSIINNCETTVTYDETSQSVKAEFTITESSDKYTVGGDFVLEPGNYVVWYENAQSYQAKLKLVEKYDLKGAGSWSLGQEDTSIWENYDTWLNGEDEDHTDSNEADDSTSSSPDTNNSTSSSSGTDDSTSSSPDTNNSTSSSSGTDDSTSSLPDTNNSTSSSSGTDDSTSSLPNTNNSTSSSPNTDVPNTSHASQSQKYFMYEIKSGDTLWGIAQTYLGNGTLYPKIMELNGLTSHLIYPGTQLKIPVNVKEYTVKRGDTLWDIARIYLGSGIRYTEIQELNGMANDTIYPGQILKLP